MERDYHEIFQIISNNNVQLDIKPIDEHTKYIKPEDDIDFHSYRILLLLLKCGLVKDEISKFPLIYGRSKFAFYDFLIRYPGYLMRLIEIKGKGNRDKLLKQMNIKQEEERFILSPMISYIRGPWDRRYDAIFNYMLSKQLIKYGYFKVTKSGSPVFCLMLTELGFDIACQIETYEPEWANRMEIINKIFRKNTTNQNIEKIIIDEFKELVMG